MNVNRSNKRKWFHSKKAWSRQYPEETITDANYADDLALLLNTSAQVNSRLHSLEKAAGGIDLYMISEKTEFMCFNQGSGSH